MSDQLPHDEELRSLYRKLPADEPRAEIDEAILLAARELAGAAASRERSGAHEGQRPRFLARAGWILPLAAAASVILTVTLTRLTPEQPAVAPSALREGSGSSLDRESPGRAAREGEVEVAGEVLDDIASGRGTAAGSPKPEYAEPAAPAPVEASRQAAENPTESARAKTATDAMEAQAKDGKRKLEARPEMVEQREAHRLTAEKKESDSLSAAGAAPPPPPTARPSVGALASRRDAEADTGKSAEAPGAARNEELAKEQPEALRDRIAPPAFEWPFHLAPGLDADQACRRIETALQTECRFNEGVAIVRPKEAAVIDRGEFAGRRITRLTLIARSGKLERVALQVEGFTTDQILAAPPAP